MRTGVLRFFKLDLYLDLSTFAYFDTATRIGRCSLPEAFTIYVDVVLRFSDRPVIVL
jgi:hypothetical protein